MTHVAVTGGAGFIGSHLVDALLERGHSVAVLDDLSTGFRENLRLSPAVSFVEGSVLDRESLDATFRNADVVFHLAAIASVPRSIDDPLLCHQVNSTGTLMVLEACRRAAVSRIVYAASSSAQGDLGDQPRSEWLHGQPRSPYAVAKYTGELYSQVYHAIHGMNIVSLRYFNVYGPRQRLRGAYTSVIPSFLVAGLRRRPAVIHGDGLQTRDFTYVEDVVHASLLAMAAPAAPGHTINVASGRSVTILELAEAVGAVLGCPLALEYAPTRNADVFCIRVDQTRARQLLSFIPATSLEEGLRRTLEWWQHFQV